MPRPDQRRPSKRAPQPKRPYQGKARKESRLPLDAPYLAQRALQASPDKPLLRAQLKGTVRHPTIFRKRIASIDPSAEHGDIVEVVSDEGTLLGYGLWNPRAEATIRMLTFGENPPDGQWWSQRLTASVRTRQELLQLGAQTSAYRVINAEGDGFPGLVADRYGDLLSLEVFTLGMYQRATAIAKELTTISGASHWLVRPGPMTFEQEGFVAEILSSRQIPERVLVEEYGSQFEIRPAEGHKTGFFCDQRENRRQLRMLCRGAHVLDLCCYSGGFSINAALGGAKSVTGIDLDEEAIAFARRNAKLNQASIKFVHADAFAYMRDMQRNGKQYEVVILDPPKLIRGREEKHEGQNKYFDFNRLAGSLVAPGGVLLTCSCSGLLSMEEFTMTVRAALGDRHPRILARSGAGPDHPVALNCLESEYLKCLWLQLDG